jgi:hypothetical protein
MRTHHIIPILFAAGCYVEPATVAYPSGAVVAVDEAPGVQVVVDYDYPVFFSDGFYWRYDGGIWLRARDYRHGGWERTRDVPARVSRIERPERFRHYHPNRAARAEHRR